MREVGAIDDVAVLGVARRQGQVEADDGVPLRRQPGPQRATEEPFGPGEKDGGHQGIMRRSIQRLRRQPPLSVVPSIMSIFLRLVW